MRNRPRGAWLAGFTIVEMMIVILLIALLIAIAVPAFLRARSLARRVACKSNLRQIHVALSSYATAYDNAVPTNTPGGEDTFPWPPGRDTTGTVQEDVTSNLIGTKSRPWGLGKLHVELGENLKVLFCPNDRHRDAAAHRRAFLDNSLLDSGDTPDCSYIFRGRDAPDKVDTAAIRLFRADGDSPRALVMDYYDTRPSTHYHENRICILFEDGTALDVAVTRGAEVDRFVVPGLGPTQEAAVDEIWRRADRIFESDD